MCVCVEVNGDQYAREMFAYDIELAYSAYDWKRNAIATITPTDKQKAANNLIIERRYMH